MVEDNTIDHEVDEEKVRKLADGDHSTLVGMMAGPDFGGINAPLLQVSS